MKDFKFKVNPHAIPIPRYFAIRAWNDSRLRWEFWHQPSGMFLDMDNATIFNVREKPCDKYIHAVRRSMDWRWHTKLEMVEVARTVFYTSTETRNLLI
jgi:hypothetical protein